MRSYNYDRGEWNLCKDTLPATISESGDFAARQNFMKALEGLGFSRYGSDLTSCMGQATIYARDHAKLPPERKANEPFDFLCTLHVGGSYIRVWITDLLNLHLFLRDINAKPEEDSWIKDLLRDDNVDDVLIKLSAALSALWDGRIEITVKSPPPPKAPIKRPLRPQQQ